METVLTLVVSFAVLLIRILYTITVLKMIKISTFTLVGATYHLFRPPSGKLAKEVMLKIIDLFLM